MALPAISIEGLSKSYRVGHQARREKYGSLRDSIANYARALYRTTADMVNGRQVVAGDTVEDFWALRDVSFDVEDGQVVGIIGRNGAGKSTLLKILSRITDPTAGRVTLRGRVASLLEVGTGFHPELTGRENIYLNGAILGMRRAEIDRKFDEIVAFSEVERFLDTPVKRYSSGMYVRLAFAVAAHLEPEILVVDEVLAVGDAAFQEKCLGKLKDVSRSDGRTVLFVSHDMGAVQALCSRALVLQEGRVDFDGPSANAVAHYFSKGGQPVAEADLAKHSRVGTGEARVLSIRIEDAAGKPATCFKMGEPITFVIRSHFPRPTNDPTLGFNLVSDTGIRLCDCRTSHYRMSFGTLSGTVEYRASIPSLMLYPRTYSIEPWIADSTGLSDYDWVKDGIRFNVLANPALTGNSNVTGDHGLMFVSTRWDVKPARVGLRCEADPQ